MKILTIYFQLLLIIPCILKAEDSIKYAPGDYAGDPVVLEGVQAFYNYHTAEAIKILSKARQDYPDNPTVHLTWAAARWLHSQANNPVEETYRILRESLEEIVPVYERLVETYPNDPVYQLYLGSAIGLEARVHLGQKEWVATLTKAYQGFSIIRVVARNNPDLVDAQLPIGIVETYASLSGSLVKWAVGLFGLEPSREAGLEKIERAAHNGKWSWTEASSISAFIYLWVYPDPEKALEFGRKVATAYPRNYYYNIQYSEALIRSGRLDEARDHLEHLENYLPELTSIQRQWYGGYTKYEWALLMFKEGEYDQALELVNQAINMYGAELDIILANAWLVKGKLLDLDGNRSAAADAYQQCIELDNYSAAIQQAKHYLDEKYSID